MSEPSNAARYRTPLSRVRGLGAARSGTEHWWMQRVTSVALIPLTLIMAALVINLASVSYVDAVVAMGHPLVVVVALLFIVASFWHMKLGLQVVIEDYVHHEGAKIVLQMIVAFGSFAVGTACVFAVLKLGFGVFGG